MYDRQPIVTTDGGTVALDWFQPRGYAKLPTDTPVVLVLHGLTGDLVTADKFDVHVLTCNSIALHGRSVSDRCSLMHIVVEQMISFGLMNQVLGL